MSKSKTLTVIAHGMEIVATNCIKDDIEQLREQFEMNYLTPIERNTPELGANRIQYLAGRFAAKRAIRKVLNEETSRTLSWLDIEVQRLPTGEPSIVLYRQGQEKAMKLGIAKWLLSISHTSAYAAASVLALGHIN